jgi:transcriptional regulator with XRE-family HTH domain
VNTDSLLLKEMDSKEYRDAYVASQINIGIPFQIRALRTSRGWNQETLAQRTGMTQPRISELEKPGARRLNIETLLRIAAALDVAIHVKFTTFGELIDWSESFDPETFELDSFKEEIDRLSTAEFDSAYASSTGISTSNRFANTHQTGAACAQLTPGQQGYVSQFDTNVFLGHDGGSLLSSDRSPFVLRK